MPHPYWLDPTGQSRGHRSGHFFEPAPNAAFSSGVVVPELEKRTEDAFNDPGFFPEALADEPRSAFFSFAPRLAGSQNQRAFFQDFFPQALNEFRGYEGVALRQGLLPDRTFTDFLSEFPFLERYLSATQEQRGVAQRRLAPNVRFAFG